MPMRLNCLRAADELTLIGNAIEREFDTDLSPTDAELQQFTTVRALLELITRRIQGT